MSGADPWFQVKGGGGVHSKICLGYFVWKITILCKKIIFFSNFRGAHPPGSTPACVCLSCYIYFLHKHTGSHNPKYLRYLSVIMFYSMHDNLVLQLTHVLQKCFLVAVHVLHDGLPVFIQMNILRFVYVIVWCTD